MSCKIITVAVMETVRLILKLAVGFQPIVYAAALLGSLLLPAMTASGWMI